MANNSEESMDFESLGLGICIKCQIKDDLALVCSHRVCSIAIHQNCLGYDAKFDDSGGFLCPYCYQKIAKARLKQTRRKVMVAKRALTRFLNRDKAETELDRGKSTEIEESGEGTRDGIGLEAVEEEEEDDETEDLGLVGEREKGEEDTEKHEEEKGPEESNESENDKSLSETETPVTRSKSLKRKAGKREVLGRGSEAVEEEEKKEDKDDETEDLGLVGEREKEEDMEKHKEEKRPEESDESEKDKSLLENETPVTRSKRVKRKTGKRGILGRDSKAVEEEEDAEKEEEKNDEMEDLELVGEREKEEDMEKHEEEKGPEESDDIESDRSLLETETPLTRSRRVKKRAGKREDLRSSSASRKSPSKKKVPGSRHKTIAKKSVSASPQTPSTRSKYQAVNAISITNFPQEKRKRLHWTEEEEEMLREGVQVYSVGKINLPWKNILEYGRNVFHETRVPSDLKDKWRTMLVKDGLRPPRSRELHHRERESAR